MPFEDKLKTLPKLLPMKITFALLFCLFALFFIACGILQPTPTRDVQTKQVVDNNLPLYELWRWSGEIGTSSDEPPKIIIQGESVLAYVDRRTIVCFDAHTGNIIWQQKFPNLASIAADTERVYVGGIEDVIAYHLKTGEIIWQKQLYKPRRGSLYVYLQENQLEVYDYDSAKPVGEREKKVFFLETGTGNIQHTIERPNLFFRYGDIYYSRVYKDFDNILVAYKKTTTLVLWQRKLYASRWPILANNVMFIEDNGIYALNPETGELYWQTEKPYSVDRDTGEISLEPQNLFISNISYGNGLIYAINGNASITGFDYKTGQKVGSIEIRPMQTQNGVYYILATSDDFLAAYYDSSQELIVFEHTDVEP